MNIFVKSVREFSVDAFPRNARRFGFTLVELLIVIAIMGLLGTVSVSGFYALKKGMEQRSVMQTVDEFVRAAYRRAVIDRVPTAVYFWNETLEDETQGDKLVVVGHAVAVRMSGRISRIEGSGTYLIDEFGDLSADAYRDEEGEEDSSQAESSTDQGRYLYRVGEATFHRSIIAPSTVRKDLREQKLLSQPNASKYPEIKAYAYRVLEKDNIDWSVGDPYGFEFAELTLPKDFIFGGNYSSSALDPEKRVDSVMLFRGKDDVQNATISVYGQVLDKSGAVGFDRIGESENPTQSRK